MTQHTPGPWRSAATASRNRLEVVTVAINPLMPPDCETPKVHVASIYAQHFEGCGATSEEAEANARLMAAAPDLLEALERMTSHLELLNWAEEDAVIAQKARAAIAKATNQ